MTGSKRVVHWTRETWYECSEIYRLSTGLPPSSRLCRLWSQKEDLQQAWNWDRRAVWDQVGLSHCRHNSLVMVRDEACLRQGHNDQSCRGHQCSKTTLTGESWFHISTPLGIEPGSLMMGSQRVVHWTSETWYECSEIAGSPQSVLFWTIYCFKIMVFYISQVTKTDILNTFYENAYLFWYFSESYWCYHKKFNRLHLFFQQ
jgi:hypothetical protein